MGGRLGEAKEDDDWFIAIVLARGTCQSLVDQNMHNGKINVVI